MNFQTPPHQIGLATPFSISDQYQQLGRPLVMGIVNITPDSFSDGGKFRHAEAAIAQAKKLRDEGADLIDIGGESTRPGAAAVTLEEELDRVIPVLTALVKDGIAVSVDTQKTEVMRAAIQAGAVLINDVNALQADGALAVCAASQVTVCLMHRQGQPQTMQHDPQYQDVVKEVSHYLMQRASACESAGIQPSRIVIDPGFGFGKTAEHNFTLLRHLPELAASKYPVLVGFSRKSSLGAVTGRAVDDRLAASLAVAMLAAQRGASIVRVHDVKETIDALKILSVS
ncbi:MAG: dihydropteroate synthase [Betaproteobacteria bacterium]|nr:dihydropteroate synthase [Betaproteobacteria bacterium]